MLIREEPGGRAERLVVSPGLDADVRSRQRLHRCRQASSGKRLLRYTVRDNCDELLHMGGDTYLDEDPVEPWPSNVIRFRARRAR